MEAQLLIKIEELEQQIRDNNRIVDESFGELSRTEERWRRIGEKNLSQIREELGIQDLDLPHLLRMRVILNSIIRNLF